MSTRFLATAVIVLALFAATPAPAAIPVSERNALIAFHDATGGPSWTNRTNWLGAPGTECAWWGVTCDSGQTAVVRLVFPANNLTGLLPAALAQLTKLQVLELPINAIAGPIPPELATLPLVDLRLSQNRLTGTIPAALGNVTTLARVALDNNDLTGGIPSTFANLSSLTLLRVYSNPRLGGTLPPGLGALTRLQELSAFDCAIGGTIPPEYGGMTALRFLRLGGNRLSGEIPRELRNLVNLEALLLGGNQLGGAIPSWVGELSGLVSLNLAENRFTGPVPSELGELARLESLDLGENALTGTLPTELGKLTAMRDFRVWNTGIGGPFPVFLASYPSLQFLYLDGNRFTGTIPSFVGTLTRLEALSLSNNALTGEIPSSLGNLVNLEDDAGLDLAYNGLTSSDPSLVVFLDSKQSGPASFTSTQTVAPTGVSATAGSPTAIRVTWTPIAYQSNAGGYRVEVGISAGGPFRVATTTVGKKQRSVLVTGLAPSTTYFVRLSTITFGDKTLCATCQKNTILSSPTAAVSVTTLPAVPLVVLTSGPGLLTVLADCASTAATSYTLTNVGQASTAITLSQSGTFFTQSPTSFTLGAGASQRVTITSLPQASATGLRGSSTPAGEGVPSSLVVPVGLLAAAPPTTGDPRVVVVSSRVDVAGPAGTNPTATVTFRNAGTATATGLLKADVPWIEPDPGVVTIAPGEDKTLSFTVNRLRRPDASALSGTRAGTLSFVYLARGGSSSKSVFAGAPSLAAPVPVSDTVRPTVSSSGIPLLGADEVGLVIPGVGNVTGSVGVFVSDLSIGNAVSGVAVPDLLLYYVASGTSLSATQAVSSGQSLALADVVATVFQKTEQIGVIHLRSGQSELLGVGASVFNKSNPSGTYGSAIPVFRTNRAIPKGESAFLTGLRKTATSHTNLYLQEVSGTAAVVDVAFLDASGASRAVLTAQGIGPFATTIVGQASVPEGTVAAVVTNGGEGAVVAYATPVDRSSGDTWAVTDWNRYYGRSGAEEQVIPVAGSAPGRNDTYFRTDISISNPGATTATAALRYYQQAPAVEVYEKPLSVEAGQTLSLDDAVVSFFGATAPSLGHVVLAPDGASLAMTSRTYTTVEGTTQTFGTGVPTMGSESVLRLGQARVIGGVKDSTAATTNAAVPGTFRTNVGLVETEGASVTVTVSVLFADGGQLAAGGAVGSKIYTLAPNEWRQLSAIVAEVLGTDLRESDYGELDNVQVKVEVTGGDGGVLVYASSTDNGSGDTLLRVE